ncbi:hypothetical protein [Hymenobacter properus]|uniref:Uncharacterized protein n=1 Tax=Hymenobacter properus TaxID=2791026 RepID=A0A931BDV5_9BACT|nr:hypothetical protein [Hymenobacter properus]MBF9142014.1 hypothetical protein [Hymenobacter properus]MBR7720821.1 hypothetical protein [Microvirga sp. SRT04]
MKMNYPTTALSARPSALASTLYIWLFTNVGGTAQLVASFGLDEPADLKVPLLIGLVAALFSLAAVPLAVPVFALAQRACTSWRCRFTALAGVLLAYAIANALLLYALPLGPPASLLGLTWPYLAAALLAVAWLYRPRPAIGRLNRPAPLLSAWQHRASKATPAY